MHFWGLHARIFLIFVTCAIFAKWVFFKYIFKCIFKENHRVSTFSESLLTWSFSEYFLKFSKKIHFLLHFGTFLKIKDFTPIFAQSNPTGQKSMSLHQFCHYRPLEWLILTLNTRRSKWDLKKGMLKRKNCCHIILNLNNVNLRKAKRPIFGHFFVVFLIFRGLPLSFGTSVIHA